MSIHPLVDQFGQAADKFAAVTEISDNLQKKRLALFETMINIWRDLPPAARAEASEHLVNLNKESKLSLPGEHAFVARFKDAVAKSTQLRRQV